MRFTTKEPWCPDTPDDSVTIDFQCVHSVCQMEGNYDGLLFYSGDYSTDGSTWKLLSSSDETYYVPDLKMVSVVSFMSDLVSCVRTRAVLKIVDEGQCRAYVFCKDSCTFETLETVGDLEAFRDCYTFQIIFELH